MTQISRPWPGTTVGDAGPYTAPHWWDVWQSMMHGSGALSGAGYRGVFACIPGRLKVTYVGPNFLNVAAGAALLDGLYYENDDDYSVTVSSATAGNVRDDRLIIRKYFAGNIQTCRLVLLPGGEAASPGPGTPPELIQDTARLTYWDIPLARVRVQDNGVMTVIDERCYVETDLVRFIPISIGVNTDIAPGNVELPFIIATGEAPSPYMNLPDGANCTVRSYGFILPPKLGGVSPLIYPVLFAYSSEAHPPGSDVDIYSFSAIGVLTIGKSTPLDNPLTGTLYEPNPYVYTAVPLVTNDWNFGTAIDPYAVGAVEGDVVHVEFYRAGGNALDTLDQIASMAGWVMYR